MEPVGIRPLRLSIFIILIIGLLVIAPFGYIRYRAYRFLSIVKAGLKAYSEDISEIDELGYPDGFMSRKIYTGKVRNREDVKRLMHGYDRYETRIEENMIVDTYIFRVLHYDDPVVFLFDLDGGFIGMPIDGPSWK